MTYNKWLLKAIEALNQVNLTENSKVDALVLLQHATGKSRTQILAFDETEIDEKVRLKLTALLPAQSECLRGCRCAFYIPARHFQTNPPA